MLDVDIEDLVGRVGRLKTDEEFLFNVRTSRKKKIEEKLEKSGLDSVLPWNFVVFLRTWGCSHNNSDSEYMAGQLAKAGFGLTSEKEAADIWLLNSCTVKTPSENQLENQIREAISRQKKVVVAGCVSQAAPNTPWLREVSIVGVEQIDKIVSVVEETLKGNNVRLLSKRGKGIERAEAMINLPKMRRNEFIEILAINSGCLNHCTYCKTKAARGDLRSIPPELLLAQAKRALTEEGCRELWLTSEDLGAWGRDIGLTIPDLLQQLVEIMPEGCMMRLGMTNPPYILDHLEEIAQILRHPRVYSFLHIPVQSGSDAVLSDMKREYSKEHFCLIVDYMMENVPNVYIATDFICAFPTETEADFEESLELIRRYKFPSIFINQFYPRPGTPAARLKKVNTVEARRRTSQMTHLFHSYRRYEDCRIGERHFVLICELASDGKHYVGHNKFYEHILVPNEDGSNSLLGKWANVQIVEVSKFYMRSKLIEMPTKMDAIMENEQSEITKNSQIKEKKEENKFPLIKATIVGLILFLLFKFLLLAFL